VPSRQLAASRRRKRRPVPNTATRLITLILLLQRRPNQKAAVLAEELGVSVRTVHRYMHMLDEMGIPIYSERGPHGGFSLVRGYKMPPLVFTLEEAVAVYLGTSLVRETWGQMYRDAAQAAMSKLENVLPDEQRREVAWARRTLLTRGTHHAPGVTLQHRLQELRRAAREHIRVSMLYRSRKRREPIQRQLDPYVLVDRWGWWYVVGYCHRRQAVRTFRVDRILELEPLDEVFQVLEDFDADQYLLQEEESQRVILVRLRFFPEMAHIAIDESYWWETVEPQPDGSVIVSQAFLDLDSAARMALSYGTLAAVLEPAELQQLVLERAKYVLSTYDDVGRANDA
jgi:predicted DNA-binding transcriptional regulator YafY